jgi:hypothetical protein
MEFYNCDYCGTATDINETVGIDDKSKSEIFLCKDCLKIYLSENWPICFIAGYEIEVNE